MSVSELTDEQVVSLVSRLPAVRKRAALLALAQESQARRDARFELGEEQLRKACQQHGKDWDSLTEDEREEFVNQLLHED
jgi:hypothetical protein